MRSPIDSPSATLEGLSPPQGATVAIHIDVTAPVNITPYVAQQKVSRFVVQEISSQLRGDRPDLNVGQRLCWSVPAVLTSPVQGAVGRVGEILVDATTGEVLADAKTVRRITDNVERLAQRSAFRGLPREVQPQARPRQPPPGMPSTREAR